MVRIVFRLVLGRALVLLAGAIVLGVLSACAMPSAPSPPKEQAKLEFTVEANAGVNPDDKGRAAPLLVRIYELKSETAFESADFFTLQNNDKALLATDVLVRDEFILRPGDVRAMHRKANPETTAIGVLAAYRDLGASVWRTTHKLPPAPEAAWYRMVVPATKVKLQIQLDAQAIRLTVLD